MSSVAHKIDFHNSLSGLVLTEERIFAANIPLEELCVLEMSETSYGPLWIRDLKKVLDSFPELYEHCRIRIFGSEQSMELWEHPSLGRRKPSLAPSTPTNPLEDCLILVRKGGVESGPFAYTEILSMVENAKLSMTDAYSIDSGKSWDRLHNIAALNRREKLNADRLPTAIPPTAQEAPFQIQFLQMKSLEAKPSNLFRGMAESGFLTAAKIAATNILFPLPRIVFSKLNEHLGGPIGQILDSKTKKVVAGITMSLGLMVLLTYIFVQILKPTTQISDEDMTAQNLSENSNVKETTPKVQSKRTPSSRTSNTQAHKNVRPPVINTSNTSFTKSNAYREARENRNENDNDMNGNNNQPDSGPYDQQEDPVEQDEIRRKLSRETIAPEETPVIDTAATLSTPVDAEGQDIIQPAPPAETFIESQD